MEDMGFSGPIFTWSNKREGNSMILERLDRGLCNRGWKNLFSDSIIHHLDFWGSDHRLLLLEAKESGRQGNFQRNISRSRRFYF